MSAHLGGAAGNELQVVAPDGVPEVVTGDDLAALVRSVSAEPGTVEVRGPDLRLLEVVAFAHGWLRPGGCGEGPTPLRWTLSHSFLPPGDTFLIEECAANLGVLVGHRWRLVER